MQLVETKDLIIFNWHEAEISGDLPTQLASVLDAMNHVLRSRGVPFSAMLKHTIAIRNGAVDPLAAIHGFHQHCHVLAPQLREEPSVGTIFRVPGFTRQETLLAIEAVFAKTPQGIRRVLFEDIQMDVARALEYHGKIFLTGFEALEFLNPELGFAEGNEQVRATLTEQVDVVLNKIDSSLKGLAADCSMLQHLCLYLREDQDPAQAQQLVRAALEKRACAPLPSGFHLSLLRGHGMAMDSFKIEIDGLALRPDAADPYRINLCCGKGSVSETVVQQAATALVAQLPLIQKQSPAALHCVLKHADAGFLPEMASALLDRFRQQLNQVCGLHPLTQLSVSLLHVTGLREPDAAIEIDASILIP